MNSIAGLSLDEAITAGLREYRERYPRGTVSEELEQRANLTGIPGNLVHTVTISYSVVGSDKPFVLFQALIDRSTGQVSVKVAEAAAVLLTLDLDMQTHVKCL